MQAERGQSVCEQTAFSEPAVVEEAQPSPGPQQENVSTAAPQSRYVKPEKLEGGEEDTNQQNRSVPHFGSKPLSENRSRARQNFPLAGHTKTHSEEVFYTGDQRANAPLRGLPTNAQSSAEMKMALSLSLSLALSGVRTCHVGTEERRTRRREERRKTLRRYAKNDFSYAETCAMSSRSTRTKCERASGSSILLAEPKSVAVSPKFPSSKYNPAQLAVQPAVLA